MPETSKPLSYAQVLALAKASRQSGTGSEQTIIAILYPAQADPLQPDCVVHFQEAPELVALKSTPPTESKRLTILNDIGRWITAENGACWLLCESKAVLEQYQQALRVLMRAKKDQIDALSRIHLGLSSDAYESQLLKSLSEQQVFSAAENLYQVTSLIGGFAGTRTLKTMKAVRDYARHATERAAPFFAQADPLAIAAADDGDQEASRAAKRPITTARALENALDSEIRQVLHIRQMLGAWLQKMEDTNWDLNGSGGPDDLTLQDLNLIAANLQRIKEAVSPALLTQSATTADCVTRESAWAAIEHVGQHNGPGRAEEAMQMLVAAPRAVSAAPSAAHPLTDMPPLTPDEARHAARSAELTNGPSDATSPTQYAMAGALALSAKLAATSEAITEQKKADGLLPLDVLHSQLVRHAAVMIRSDHPKIGAISRAVEDIAAVLEGLPMHTPSPAWGRVAELAAAFPDADIDMTPQLHRLRRSFAGRDAFDTWFRRELGLAADADTEQFEESALAYRAWIGGSEKTLCAALLVPQLLHTLADEVIIASHTGNLDLLTEKLQALVSQVKAISATGPLPTFWYRPRSDGGYDGPLHNDSIEDCRKQSGAWVPLYAGAAPLPQA